MQMFTCWPSAGGNVLLRVCAVTLAASVATAGEPPARGDLRKLAVHAVASSEEKGFPAGCAFDDDPGTRWSSEWKDHQGIYADLGAARRITEIRLQWQHAYASDYDIKVSDDAKSWRTVKKVEGSRGGVESFLFEDLEARYVGLRGRRRATQWGISLREFGIYGPVDGPQPEFAGLVRPAEIVTIFDHDYERLSAELSAQCAQDPPDSSGLSDDEFLDLVARRAFGFFWYEVHPKTLFIVDSTTWKARTSNAGIGFQLGAYIVGHFREYQPRDEMYRRVETLLDHCWDDPSDPSDLCIEHHEGWTYHWTDIETGRWMGEEHVCTHDSIVYLCGVMGAARYFGGTRAGGIASNILAGVKWDWVIHDGWNKELISNCYAPTFDPPCGGVVHFYDGMKLDYLLPIGGDRNAISPSYWHNYAMTFPWDDYKGRFWRIQRPAPWIHYWDDVWFDFRHLRDDYADYHQNSLEAILANREWCVDHASYDGDLWGVGPSRGPTPGGGARYGSYGAPPDDLPYQKGTDNDGTITPSAALPCIVFAPTQAIRVARAMYDRYRDRFWRRYGFPDAMNPSKDWFDREYISIDQGPIVINIENHRSGLMHRLFDQEAMVRDGLRRAGFVGVVDNFDESEHSAPYGTWQGNKAFRLGKADDAVREGRWSLRVGYNVRGDARDTFFSVKPARRDFSPYRYLALWVRRDPGLQVVLATSGGELLPLAESASRTAAQGWTRRFFAMPDAARAAPVEEIRFALGKPATGVCWLDAIFLTHDVSAAEPELVVDDFDARRSTWSAESPYRVALVSGGGPADPGLLRIEYSKSGTGDLRKVVSCLPAITNWSRCHSVAAWVKGDVPVLLRLADGAGRSFDVGTHTPRPGADWTHAFFNIQANLNPSNCWEPRYDKRDIREMQWVIAPGQTDCAGEVFFDSIVLTE